MFGQAGVNSPRSQLEDYRFRGPELEAFGLIFFIADTYDRKIGKKNQRSTDDVCEDANLSEDNESDNEQVQNEAGNRTKRGRKPNERSCYLEGHSRHKTHFRVVRTPGHNCIPSTRGGFYPTHTDPDTLDFFRASMLTICKPWRSMKDLKAANETWEEAYDAFLREAPKRIHHIISGVKYHYDSRTSASIHREREEGITQSGRRRRRRNAYEDLEHDNELEDEEELTDLERQRLLKALEDLEHSREEVHGDEALEIARSAGVFRFEGRDWSVEGTQGGTATGDDLANLQRWQAQLKSKVVEVDPIVSANSVMDEGTVQLQDGAEAENVEYVPPDILEFCKAEMAGVDPSCLFDEQRRAFDIVNYHLQQTLAGKRPPQLLLHVPGQGGTGKSKLIQTITEQYQKMGVGNQLVKAAYTGIAASLIGGSTLHVICRIPPPREGNRDEVTGEIIHSAEVEKQLSEFYSNKQCLIIDEISMVPRAMFSEMSRIISKARAHLTKDNPDLPFGGLNVIILGDMHQFPPVTGGAPHALFTPLNRKDLGKGRKESFIQGREIYTQFEDVVKLRKQVRVVDERWKELLGRARHGNCRASDLRLLRSLIIGSEECPPTDFENGPWSEAVLVTPRHAVRRKWNDAAVERHCRLKKVTLYKNRAVDEIKGRRLNGMEEYLMKQKKDTCLAPEVKLAIGMKVMVTFNVNTEKDIANGSRGTIYGIVLDEREPQCEGPRVELKYPPAYVLVKLDHSKAASLDGLPEGVVPIVPIQKDFYIKKADGRKVKVTRTQLPITAAYAFTDYRSQGQTIQYVIVDIGRPPSGKLTGFNAYVALSRSSGAATIRLLRDFDNRLFTQHPSEDLRAEDRRLEDLDKATWRKWDIILDNISECYHDSLAMKEATDLCTGM